MRLFIRRIAAKSDLETDQLARGDIGTIRYVLTPSKDNPRVAGWRAGLLYPVHVLDEVTVYRDLDKCLTTGQDYTIGILMEGDAELEGQYKSEDDERIKAESEVLLWDFWTSVLHLKRPTLKT